ncbi:stage II sporulation protein M [Candidatus Woesearchaeota archaeon]|nr:stage II sporulation protein M [Candidatus Woesearchaeota archaeon]
MVLEDIFNVRWVKHRPYLAFVFGFLFTVVSYFVSLLFFSKSISVSIIFLTTLLLVPTMILLLKIEESVERKYGLKNFFSNHKDIFEVYLFAFLGVFAGFILLGIALFNNAEAYGSVFEFQIDFLKHHQGLSEEGLQAFVSGTAEPSLPQFGDLVVQNLLVVFLCFVLSFVYGASAIFLIILNGSIFANFIVFVLRTISQNVVQGAQALFLFLIHMVPEVSGFLLAAIAGGIVSKAVMYEKRGTKEFKNVFKDATMLMLISAALVLLGALLEVFVTARLFQVLF